jgi:hypothetical protein
MNTKPLLFSWLLFILAVVIFSSCSSMLFTTIDILRPAKVTFPAEITSVALINNSAIQDPEYGHTIQLLNQQEKRIRINTDSLSIFCLASLAEGMAKKEFFSKVILEPDNINPGSSFHSVSIPRRSEVEDVQGRNRVDGIISLNRILVKDKQGEFYNQEYYTYVSYLEAYYETQWSVHFPSENKIYTFTENDTIYWESEDYSRQRALQGMPDRTNALIDGALIVGEKSVNRFIPWWDKVDRYFFYNQSKLFKQGMDAVYRKDWSTAALLWEEGLGSFKNNVRNGKLAHNLAVIYELKGDITKAKKYSDTALNFFMSSFATKYQHLATVLNYNEELAVRMQESAKVTLQLGEESGL